MQVVRIFESCTIDDSINGPWVILRAQLSLRVSSRIGYYTLRNCPISRGRRSALQEIFNLQLLRNGLKCRSCKQNRLLENFPILSRLTHIDAIRALRYYWGLELFGTRSLSRKDSLRCFSREIFRGR